ncbi:HDIG domain-containing metalloprotein [Clostridium sp. 'White wine YQ']|uniref:HDIG domain-containing metalloprotein n=1 Tax=Clostridium sp. 'White wine YQ' TaxID=3027474 RepID=UPI002366051E|nr:HDIG domain-containing metalloprotein [Clostridium sp. 'White wine YQ']MDD7796453.1 HDIG domain-containing protein [Clostridium sp. 'White wine YQ']
MSVKLSRAEAWDLLREYNKSESLLNHALTVEGVMRYFARLLNQEDIDKWGIIGLLHDLDYEMYPDEHCIKVQEILREHDIDEEYIHAIASHGYGICCDIEPVHLMEKVLYTIDELTGLITAAAIMRPSKSVLDLELKSVKKKYKSKGFAAGVDRTIIENGAKMLGMDLDYIIEHTILAMREIADSIGLGGIEDI